MGKKTAFPPKPAVPAKAPAMPAAKPGMKKFPAKPARKLGY